VQVLLVEDRPSMRETLTLQLERAGGASVVWAPHYGFAPASEDGRRPGLGQAADLLARADLVLLDAFDRDQTQDDPTRSALRGLDATALVRALPIDERPRVVAYSTAMAWPEVAVTLHTTGVVAARYQPRSLLDHLPAVLLGGHPGAEPEPVAADWKRIHPDLRPGADLARLHEVMEGNPRAWRLVWDPDAPFDQAVQQWVRRQILPWLSDAPHPGYRVAVDVCRRLAGLGRPAVG
jgi:CheY-like chemotaxis protein